MSEINYNARAAYAARRKKRIRLLKFRRFVFCFFTVIITASLIGGGVWIYRLIRGEIYDSGFIPGPYGKNVSEKVEKAETLEVPRWVDVQLIHKHNTARSGIWLTDIKNIVIHYVGNAGTSAQNNRDYFDKADTTVSSHFVVGLEGEIIQCVPLNEKSAASNDRNKDTISIEVCHPDDTGKYSDATYESVIKLTAWLCHEFELDEKDVIRHYDITGKLCPKYYAEHEDQWELLRQDVKERLDDYEA